MTFACVIQNFSGLQFVQCLAFFNQKLRQTNFPKVDEVSTGLNGFCGLKKLKHIDNGFAAKLQKLALNMFPGFSLKARKRFPIFREAVARFRMSKQAL